MAPLSARMSAPPRAASSAWRTAVPATTWAPRRYRRRRPASSSAWRSATQSARRTRSRPTRAARLAAVGRGVGIGEIVGRGVGSTTVAVGTAVEPPAVRSASLAPTTERGVLAGAGRGGRRRDGQRRRNWWQRRYRGNGWAARGIRSAAASELVRAAPRVGIGSAVGAGDGGRRRQGRGRGIGSAVGAGIGSADGTAETVGEAVGASEYSATRA